MLFAPPDLPLASIEVRLWGCLVGFVHQGPLGCSFQYDPAFSAKGWEPAPLVLPVGHAQVASKLPEETYHGLPAMLADALPDEFGLSIIRGHLARHRSTALPVSALDFLAQVGSAAIGAFEFAPAFPLPSSGAPLLASDLVHACLALQDPETPRQTKEAALDLLLPVGISAGGQRAKAVVAYDPATGQMRDPSLDSGDFSSWLIKLDGVPPATKNRHAEPGKTAGFGQVEYAYHLMARAAGITMSDCALLEENGRTHFLTRRFDRTPQGKLHVQSLCAMAHMDYKARATHDYNDLFRVITRLGLPPSDRQEAFRRMAFNVLAFNCDDHTKNFAFTMDQSGAWRLSPAYDVTFAYNPQSYWVNQHLMGVNGKFKDITTKDLLAFASSHAVDAAPRILNEVIQAVSNWSEFANQANVSSSLHSHVSQYLNPIKTSKMKSSS